MKNLPLYHLLIIHNDAASWDIETLLLKYLIAHKYKYGFDTCSFSKKLDCPITFYKVRCEEQDLIPIKINFPNLHIKKI
jgi:hypothetical protein